MFTKNAGAVIDGLNASGDYLDQVAVVNVAGGGSVPLGAVLMRDVSQLVSVGTNGSQGSLPANLSNPGPFVAQTDILIPPNAPANVGDVYGVNQNPPTALAVGSFTTARPVVCRRVGIGWVYAGMAAGGAAIAVNSLLIATGASAFAVVGARAFGVNVGRVTAYPVNTTLTAAVLAIGSQTVAVATAIGINTSTVLTVDSGAQLETVTPTASSYGALSSATVTIAGVAGVNTLTATVGGIAALVNTTGTDTATTAMTRLVAALNASAAVAGLTPIVQLVTNAAGVATIVAANPGTGGNAITLTAAATGAGGFTIVASSATLVGGVQPTITAVFAKTHVLGTTLQGITTSGTLVTAPTVGYLALPVLADINTLL